MSVEKKGVWIVVLSLAAVCCIAGCEGVAEGPCMAAVERLGPYELDSEGFVTDWLVVGPFPNPGERPTNEGFHVDYLKEYGGEAKHVPAEGMEIAKADGTTVKWLQYRASYGYNISFFSINELELSYEQEDILTYSACRLECEKDMDVEIRVGSDDGYKLWVDHKLVGEEHVYRAAYQDQESYPMRLSKGTHLVLIKVDQDYGAFEFMLRVLGADGLKAEGIKVWN
jgi:hypothetical protein